MTSDTGTEPSLTVPVYAIPAQEQENPLTPMHNILNHLRSNSNKRVYLNGWATFIDYLMGSPVVDRTKKGGSQKKRDALFYHPYEQLTCDYMSQTRNYETDLLGFIRYLIDNGFAPLTTRTYVTTALEYLKFYNKPLSEKSQKMILKALPYPKPATEHKHVNRKVLQEILLHTDVRMSALVLFLASSGCRIGEAHNVRLEDVHIPDRKEYPDKPTSIYIRESKTGPSRWTYISRECENALKEWVKVRQFYVATNRKRGRNLPDAPRNILKDDLLFPWHQCSSDETWRKLLKETSHSDVHVQVKTRRIKMNLHRLRNFFFVAVSGVVGEGLANLWMGHKDAYKGAYIGRSEEDFDRDYCKAEPALTVGQISFADEATTKKISSMETELTELKRRMAANDEVIRLFNALPPDKKAEFELWKNNSPQKQ